MSSSPRVLKVWKSFHRSQSQVPVSAKNSVLNFNSLKHKFNKIPVGQTVLNLFMLEQHVYHQVLMVWTLFHQSRSQGPVSYRKNSAVIYFMHSQQNVKGITEITVEVVRICSGIT